MADEVGNNPDGDDEDEYVPTPWHFKLLLLALVLYLGYRLIQLIVWVVQHI